MWVGEWDQSSRRRGGALDVSGISNMMASSRESSVKPILPDSSSSPSEPALAASIAPPGDTVVLSPAAQQILAGSVVAPPNGSPAPGDTAVQQGITALNDTSGKFSVADQLQAYGLVANFVKSQTGPEAAASASTTDAVTALYDVPFAQHAQQLLNKIGGTFDWSAGSSGDAKAASIDKALSAFDALSATDQQIYVGAIGLQHQMMSGESPITKTDDYRANLEAQANVDRALQAAMSSPAYASALDKTPDAQSARVLGVTQGFYNKRDDLAGLASAAGDQATTALVKLTQTAPDTVSWTQQVQAYFAKYGPPPASSPTASAPVSSSSSPASSSSYQAPDGKRLAAAIAAVNDTTGKAAFTDQASAYRTLMDYGRFGQDAGPARAATFSMLATSPFTKQIDAAAQQFFSNPLGSGSAVIALLNKQSSQQQELIFLGAGYGQGFTSLDAWKAQLSEDQAANNAESSPDQIRNSSIDFSTRSVSTSNAPTSTIARSTVLLNSTQSFHSNADIALTLLQSAIKTYGRNRQT